MDKATYCEDIRGRLRDLEAYLGRLTFPSPSTLAASLQQEETKRTVLKLKTMIAEAHSKVEELQTSTDPLWDMGRQDLDNRWQEIAELKTTLD
jgi:hypothetical protein